MSWQARGERIRRRRALILLALATLATAAMAWAATEADPARPWCAYTEATGWRCHRLDVDLHVPDPLHWMPMDLTAAPKGAPPT